MISKFQQLFVISVPKMNNFQSTLEIHALDLDIFNASTSHLVTLLYHRSVKAFIFTCVEKTTVIDE
jgi:hypothetical protein